MLVDGWVVGEFGVKRGGEEISLLYQSRLAIVPGEHGNFRSNAFDHRPTDENHFQRLLLQGGWAEENITRELAAIAIAENRHVHEGERGLRRIFDVGCEQNRSRAGAENGVAIGGELADGVVEALFLEELELRGALASGKNDAVAAIKILYGADFDGVRAELLKHGGVGCEITLYS